MKFVTSMVTAIVILVSPNIVLADEGKEIYIAKCQMCHGEKGHGDGPVGKSLKAADIFAELKEHADDEAHLIEEVMEGEGAMPGWKGILSTEQVKKVFAYIRDVQ